MLIADGSLPEVSLRGDAGVLAELVSESEGQHALRRPPYQSPAPVRMRKCGNRLRSDYPCLKREVHNHATNLTIIVPQNSANDSPEDAWEISTKGFALRVHFLTIFFKVCGGYHG